MASTVTLMLMALITVIARSYVRLGMIRSFGWDDAFMNLTMITSISLEGLVIAGVHYGAGRHIGDISHETFEIGMKLNFIAQPIFVAAVSLCKVAVGASLMRISKQTSWYYVVLVITTLMAAYNLASAFTIIFQCSDIRVLWDPEVPSVCWKLSVILGLSYANVVMNILTDFIFAVVIPIPMLWKLNVNRRQRWSLIGILGLGIFACVAACVKSAYLLNYGAKTDPLWQTRNITIWNVAELNVGIIAGSLPTLRPLFPGFLGGTNTSSYGHMKGSYAKESRRGTLMPNRNNWLNLSSERNIVLNGNGQESYEMVQYTATVVAGHDSTSRLKDAGEDGNNAGITKTTTTRMNYTDMAK